MRSGIFFIIILIASSAQAFGQNENSKFDVRHGIGVSLLGSGDLLTFNYENEVNYNLNRYFTGSLTTGLGRSTIGAKEFGSLAKVDFNFFLSPFTHDKIYDLRIGSGLSYYRVNDMSIGPIRYDSNGNVSDVDFSTSERQSWGYNIIIENTVMVSNRFMIGLKMFTQPYFNGDINTGFIFKVGFKL